MPNETPPVIGGIENPSAEDSRVFTQEEVNRLVGKVRVEERGKYEGYDEYKKSSEELKSIKEASKSELEKANERALTAERERDALKSEKERKAWAKEVAESTGVPVAVLKGSTKEEIESLAEELRPYFKKDAAPVVESDGFVPPTNSSKSTAELFASALDGIL